MAASTISRVAPFRFTRRSHDASWAVRGCTADGASIWERIFPARGGSGPIRARVIYRSEDPEPCVTFALTMQESDRVPSIPSAVRREAADFARFLALSAAS